MENKNIIAVRNLIRFLDERSLQNIQVVENLIKAFGLVQWGPNVFGDDETFKNSNIEMAGIYQVPVQLASALVYLSKFSINSYCEIGVFQGGTFLFVSEYLRRFNPQIRCIGIDPTDYLNKEIAGIMGNEYWLSFNHITSDGLNGIKFDLVFIDGEHFGGWTARDYENVGRYAKICMFHDIQETTCPEVMSFWQSLKETEEKKIIEYLEHSASVPLQGIGILHDEVAK